MELLPLKDFNSPCKPLQLEVMRLDDGWNRGCSNSKWTAQGSRSNDVSLPVLRLMAKHDARLHEQTPQNTEQMAACATAASCFAFAQLQHEEYPGVHYAFTHAKALTTDQPVLLT